MFKNRVIIATIMWITISILVYLNLEHIIYFMESSHLFLFDRDYVGWYLSEVGGTTGLAVSFLVQFFYYPMVGAAIVGALVAGIYALLAWSSATKERGDQFALASLIAVWLLSYHSFPTFMDILVVVVVNLLLLKVMTIKLKRVGYAMAFLAVVAAFLITGLPFYMSVVLFSVYMATSREAITHKAIYIASIGLLAYALPHLAPYIYPQSLDSIFEYENELPVEAYQTFTIVCSIYLLFVRYMVVIKRKKIALIISAVVVASSLGWGASIASSSNGVTAKTVLLLRQMAEKGEWNNLLKAAQEVKKSNRFVTYFLNCALYKTGKFNQYLFAIPQNYGIEGLYFPWSEDEKVAPIGRYAYENAGIINEACRWVFEQSAAYEESGYNLTQLVDYYREMGKYRVANRFAKIVNRSLFYHREITDEKELPYAQTKSDSIHQDLVVSTNSFELNLRQALMIDESNRGASDYLMALLLMQGRVVDFGALIYIPKAIYGESIPEIYNEAMALYARTSPEQFAESGYTIPPATMARLTQFEADIQKSRGNVAQLSGYRGSYWYYYLYMNPYRKQQ